MRPSTRPVFALLLTPALTTVPTTAQSEWLPTAARDAAVRDVVEKLEAIDTESRLTPEVALEAARAGVHGLAAKAEELGAERLIALTPVYPDLGLPSSGSTALDAIGAYQLCSLPMNAIYADDSPRANRFDERTWALFLSLSVDIVTAYLRPVYRDEGWTDARARAFLDSSEMKFLRDQIRTSRELLQSTKDRCSEPLIELMN
jgi:hypothetical protein